MFDDVNRRDGVARDAEVVLDVTTTIDDQMRYNEHLLWQPAMRQRRAVRMALSLVVYPVVGMLIGLAGGAIGVGQAPTLQFIRTFVRQDVWGNLLLPWLLLAGFYVAVWTIWWVTLRPRMRRLLRRHLRDRPGVDPADPTLGERVRCTFEPKGYRIESPGYTHEVPWQGIQGLDETPDLLVVRTGLAKGYVLPKRDIPADLLAAIKAMTAAHGDGMRTPPARHS